MGWPGEAAEAAAAGWTAARAAVVVGEGGEGERARESGIYE